MRTDRRARARRWRRRVGTVSMVLAAVGGCGGSGGPVAPPEGPDGPQLRVLFVGNSLTYTNDLPGLVAAVAEAAGEERAFVHQSITRGNTSLIEHWSEGRAAALIASGDWDVVVLQQGPSSTPANRQILIDYAERFAGVAREAGAEPALYMVWPETSRRGAFVDVSRSYQLAAEAVDGVLLPVGEAWRAAWDEDPDLPLYSLDGFHPSLLGSVVAALVIYGELYGRSPVGLPARFDRPGGSPVEMSPELAALVQRAADRAIRAF